MPTRGTHGPRPEASARFIGRRQQLARLRAQGTSALRVVWVHGIGGVGKSTLLRESALRAASAGAQVAWLAVDLTEPRPSALVAAAAASLGVGASAHSLEDLLDAAPGATFIFDNLEAAPSLESWLLDEVARTDAAGLVVVGSRDAPSARWTSPHLHGRFEAMELANFDADESSSYLKEHGVSEPRHAEVLAFTRGHPLALAVVSELARASGNQPLRPVDSPNALRVLLEALVGRELGERERWALEAAAIAPRVTEPLLGAMLDDPSPYELVRWLQSRPYVSAGPRGLVVHDLVREVVAADLRWRNAERYQRYMMRACEHLTTRLETLPLSERQMGGAELLWMVRRERGYGEMVAAHGQLGEAMEVFGRSPLYLDGMRDDDVASLVAMVEQFAGAESGRVCRHWVRAHPEMVTVARSPEGDAHGLWLELHLQSLSAASVAEDPAMRAIARHVRRLKLSRRDGVVVSRFYIDGVSGRDLGPTTPLSPTAEIGLLLSTPRLALRFLVAPADIAWAGVWAQLGYTRIESCNFEQDGVAMGAWQLDLRGVGASAYVRGVFAGMVQAGSRPSSAPPRAADVDRDFLGAVRAALRAMRDPVELARTPLAQSAELDLGGGGDATGLERAAALRARVSEALESMGGTAKGERWRRAIAGTYLESPASQEEIAERLGVPFRTYRDHLTHGVLELARRLQPGGDVGA